MASGEGKVASSEWHEPASDVAFTDMGSNRILSGTGTLTNTNAHGYGKRSINVAHEHLKHNFLTKGPTPEPQFHPIQGTSQTRFHTGFYRRNQDKIRQDAERLSYESHREELAKVRHAARSEYLKNKTGGNRGVNIITGMENPTAVVLEAQRRHYQQVVSKELRTEGEIKLRSSSSRFFRDDQAVARPTRKQCLTHEGLLPRNGVGDNDGGIKYSSCLGIGNNDIKSQGVNDNFTNSYQYTTKMYAPPAPASSRSNTSRTSRASGRRPSRPQSTQADIDSVRGLQ